MGARTMEVVTVVEGGLIDIRSTVTLIVAMK